MIFLIQVTVIGGGGGASSRDYSSWSGAHGAGGGAAIKNSSVASGTKFVFTVGKGGIGRLVGDGAALQWGKDGTAGTDSVFEFDGIKLVGQGGGIAAFKSSGGKGGKALINNAIGGSGVGGDVNCKGGDGGFCSNGYFYCAAQSAPVCDGKQSGQSRMLSTFSAYGSKGGGGGGGGASQYGGNGVSVPSDRQGCGGGGGDFMDGKLVRKLQLNHPDYTNDYSNRGSHGCVIVTW